MKNNKYHDQGSSEIFRNVYNAWKYLSELTNGKDLYLKFFKVKRIKRKNKTRDLFRFLFKEFVRCLKVPPEEFPLPKKESYLSFYLDCLDLRIRQRERDMLDLAVEHNLSYLERLSHLRNKKSELPYFFRKSEKRVIVSPVFLQWVEITQSELKMYSAERGLSLDDALKELYLEEIVKEIEELEHKE